MNKEIEHYALMLSNNYDSEQLKKIIGYIDSDLKRIELWATKLNKLKQIAEERIK